MTLAKLIPNICNLISISTLQQTLTRKCTQKTNPLGDAFTAEICISETLKTIFKYDFHISSKAKHGEKLKCQASSFQDVE